MSARATTILLSFVTALSLGCLHAALTKPALNPARLARDAGTPAKEDFRAAQTHLFAAAAFRSFAIAY